MPRATLLFQHPGTGESWRIHVNFADTALARSVQEALAATEHEAVQARYSGPATCVLLGNEVVVPEGLSEEGTTTDFDPGQIGFNVGLGEAFLSYGPKKVRFRDLEEIYPSHLIGTVENDDLATLQVVGELVWKRGVRVVTLKFDDA